jgi:two-component system NtrC family response regulator
MSSTLDTPHPTPCIEQPTPSTAPDGPKLLIVDDDDAIRTQMKWALAQDYTVLLAEDRPSALTVMKKECPLVVTLDLGLPPRPRDPEEGLQTLAELLEHNPAVKVVVITGQTEKENALQAIGQGAYDFLCKPIEIGELRGILRRALHVARLEYEHRELQQQHAQEGESGSFEGMLGGSPQMRGVFSTIRKVAPTDASVLIVGESGTGKELAARAIHQRSDRARGPFVAINCGAIPDTLLESELFGHEKGAFTGAHVQRKGRVETAQGGTLFLDEIGELPVALQVKLLRFLQERVIERVGGREAIPVDVRVIAATNVDLKKAIVEGRFREDLYYRLAVLELSLPPLRERQGDIELISGAFLQRYVAQYKKKLNGFSQQALRVLETYQWPGNIREMENRLKRAVIIAEGAKVAANDLELTPASDKYEGIGLKEAREAVERELVTQAITRNKGNLSRAAVELGISRPTLYELMEKLGIRKVGSGE